jgi:hypothetical protein
MFTSGGAVAPRATTSLPSVDTLDSSLSARSSLDLDLSTSDVDEVEPDPEADPVPDVVDVERVLSPSELDVDGVPLLLALGRCPWPTRPNGAPEEETPLRVPYLKPPRKIKIKLFFTMAKITSLDYKKKNSL